MSKSGFAAFIASRRSSDQSEARSITARLVRGNVSAQYERFLTEDDLSQLSDLAEAELRKLEERLSELEA